MSENNEICCQTKSEGNEPAALQVRPGATYKPAYQSRYSDNAWEVSVNLPGVLKEHLDVTIENEILQVKATRLADTPEGWRPLADYPAEKHYRLRLDVGPEVDPSGVTAGLEDGVLKLALPLREEVKPRTIEVQ
ncbi:MAG: Hsp20/alpha crystallin family protein [Verrucomicrobiales bacterium]|nr:Hsp20/alpha crystallin family protein [Verrucomicrobiales bacterium]